MADTDTETLPNGTGGLSTEEEDERMKQRPADIDADVREMERRKRVEALMSSKLFREELERVLDQQMNEGADAPLLQRIKEMVGGRLHTGSLRGPSCVLPINDIRGIEGVGYEKGEKILRCKLAAVYRLVDLFGWTQTGIGSQITARLNTAVEQVLTSPRGMSPHEVTASSLVKVDMQGTVQDQGTTNFPVNVAGFSVHASVHAARPDVRCVLHIRSPATLAVSAMRSGLLPLSTESAVLGEIAYHTVPPGVLDNEERDKMIHVLGPHCKVLFLTSHGALCCGETLEEAFYQAKILTTACDVQLRLAALPRDELYLIDDETRRQIYEASRKPPADGVKWRVGGEEFEALMRMLDNAGFRTGYIYRHPLVKNDVPRPRNDVEVPPAVSSLGYLLEEEEMYKQGLWKKGGGKVGERTRWLNSPNVYQKVEVLETGTTDPKKITKWVDANNEEWVQDGSPAHSSTPVKIDAALQFVPKNTNPKEFKKLQQQIKDNRRADKISAGPQSHILEGVTWDEANKLNAEDANTTHTGDHVVLMGAASKGIIQRGYQHNATMYSAPYARNPFDHVTDREIDEYKRTVERRQRGGDYDTDLSETEALSAAQVTSPLSPSETEEESRDEHRVLRIETKQAPIRSQPEVVLSDVDTTDFLHAERSHADHSRDANLLSDDEVFLSSMASSVTTSALVSPVTSSVDEPVVVRHQRVAVQQTVIRDVKPNDPITSPHKPQANKFTLDPAPRTNRRKHDYPRSANFDNIVKKYDSPERETESNKMHPKCKMNLNSRLLSSNESVPVDALEVYQQNAGSRSSLYSIPSIEWDGKCKAEYFFKTRSLPRSDHRANKTKLIRTRSHAGFINSFIKDPEPLHFHLPKCRSCGAVNSSYAWELTRDSIERIYDSKRTGEGTVYESLNNETQRCIEERNEDKTVFLDVVKVKQVVVPIHKVTVENEFVESQEFNEDCYLGEIANSFSSDNQTIIENTPTTTSVKSSGELTLKGSPIDPSTTKAYDEVVKELNDKFDDASDIYRAEYAMTEENEDNLEDDVNNASVDSIEGEYQNFSDEMDFEQAVYESPVKNLVEKDIRDYSVPINFYCEDYKNDKSSPKKSPHTKREISKPIILESILEESKSSYGDESCIANSSKKNECESMKGQHKDDSITKYEIPIIKELLADVIHTVIKAIELKEEILNNTADKVTSEELEMDYKNSRGQESFFVAEAESDLAKNDLESVLTAMGLYSEENESFEEAEAMEDKKDIAESVYKNLFAILSEDAIFKTDIISDTSVVQMDLVDKSIAKKSVTSEFSTASTGMEMQSFNSTVEFEKYEAVTEIIASILDRINYDSDKISLSFCDAVDLITKRRNIFFFEITNPSRVKGDEDVTNLQATENADGSDEFKEAESTPRENTDDDFSISKMIQDIENQVVGFNETVLTNNSDLDPKRQSEKVVEGIIYHLLDITFFSLADKMVNWKDKKNKKVVTVVDIEDILFTSSPIWVEKESGNYENDDSFHTPREVVNIEEIVKASFGNNTIEMALASAAFTSELVKYNDQSSVNFLTKSHQDVKSATDCSVCLPGVLIMPLLETESQFIEPDEYEAIPNIESLPETVKTVIYNVLDDENDESGSVYEEGLNDLQNNESFTKDPDDLETNITNDKTTIITYDFKNKDDIADVTENTYEQKNDLVICFEVQNLTESIKEREEHTYANFQKASDEDVVDEVFDDIPDQYVEKFGECSTTYQDLSNDEVEEGYESDSFVLAKEMIKDLIGISWGECSDVESEENESTGSNGDDEIDVLLNKTFVMNSDDKATTEKEEMNTAFFAEHLSFSSPVKDHSKIFDGCEESPIKNADNTFLGEDLSVLYEKDDTILGSPFIKKASVISMSQSLQSGGIKYWVSFDDSLSNVKEKPTLSSVGRFKGNSMPSFITIDFDDDKKSDEHIEHSWTNDKPEYWEVEKESVKRASVLCEEMTNSGRKSETDKSIFSSNTNESFATACASKTASYHTCESSGNDNILKETIDEDTDIPKKRLIYDNSRVDLHSLNKRQCYSWPPFEESVFYRIISKFRMSESFDPSDLENFESSL